MFENYKTVSAELLSFAIIPDAENSTARKARTTIRIFGAAYKTLRHPREIKRKVKLRLKRSRVPRRFKSKIRLQMEEIFLPAAPRRRRRAFFLGRATGALMPLMDLPVLHCEGTGGDDGGGSDNRRELMAMHI